MGLLVLTNAPSFQEILSTTSSLASTKRGHIGTTLTIVSEFNEILVKINLTLSDSYAVLRWPSRGNGGL